MTPGGSNKLSADGFWRAAYLCLMPYRCGEDMARDAILKSWPFRMVGHPLFAVLAQVNKLLAPSLLDLNMGKPAQTQPSVPNFASRHDSRAAARRFYAVSAFSGGKCAWKDLVSTLMLPHGNSGLAER